MRRLLRFFVLTMLRVVAVCTLILWGTSRVQHIRVMVPIGSTAATLQTCSDGYCLAVFSAPNSTLQFDVLHGKNMSLVETFQDRPALFGAPIRIGREPQAIFVAGAYWLILLVTVLLYGGIEYRGRRRRLRSVVSEPNRDS